jgi:hypothetical protein
MEITKLWGREIAIRSVVRRISVLGMYSGRGKDGRSYFLLDVKLRVRQIRQVDQSLLGVLGDGGVSNAHTAAFPAHAIP